MIKASAVNANLTTDSTWSVGEMKGATFGLTMTTDGRKELRDRYIFSSAMHASKQCPLYATI